MKLIEKNKSSYERLKELDNEILEIQRMEKKLAAGDPEFAHLELKVHYSKSAEYSDSYSALEALSSSYMSGLFGRYPKPDNEGVIKSEPQFTLEYYNAIVFLQFLEKQKDNERLSIIEFLSQFEK
ncbi:hypothetical protein [Epilithonimonas hominis]|uniref:hypothetical protein n=1 Tax=Epilithonimonas hominis TaxID=420404 RepID=UPI002898B2FE|nr:hypothetical protein [Epilithonimonas hominis]